MGRTCRTHGEMHKRIGIVNDYMGDLAGTTLVQRILLEQGPGVGNPRTVSGWDRTRHAAVNCHLYSEPRT